jgi:hypothetical protein
MKEIGEIALALDDFQYNLCNNLTNQSITKYLDPKDLTNYTKALMGAQACMLFLRNSLEAFKQDPIGQEDNLDRALGLMQSFVQNVTPELKTNDSRISVSNVFSAIDIDENKLDSELLKSL